MTTKSKKEKRQRRYSDAKEIADKMSEGFSPTAFKLPDGVQLFRFKEEKTYVLDILPYKVGEGNPRADEGMLHFERTYYTHTNIGPDNAKYVCPYKNSGKKCPICQFKTKLAMNPKTKKEVIKALEPKMRQFFLVIDHDDREAGIQIFETAYYKSFGELLKNKIKAGDDDSPYQNFFHLEDGYYLKVTTEEDSFNGKTFYKPANIEMRKRKTPLDEDLLDDAPCLDDVIVELPYDELKEIFTQAPDEDDDEVEEDSELEEEDDDSGEEEGGSSKKSKGSQRKSGKSSQKPSKKDEEDDDDVEDPSDLEDDDDETDERDSKKSKKSRKASKGSKEADDEDQEEKEVEDPSDLEDEPEEDSETEEEESEIGVGDRVKGLYKKKLFKGKVSRVKTRKGQPDLITVETDGGNQRVMDADELEIISKAKAEDDEEGEDDEEETPKKKSKSSKTSLKKASKDDDDDDDDLPFDDDGAEEEDD